VFGSMLSGLRGEGGGGSTVLRFKFKFKFKLRVRFRFTLRGNRTRCCDVLETRSRMVGGGKVESGKVGLRR